MAQLLDLSCMMERIYTRRRVVHIQATPHGLHLSYHMISRNLCSKPIRVGFLSFSHENWTSGDSRGHSPVPHMEVKGIGLTESPTQIRGREGYKPLLGGFQVQRWTRRK